MRPAFPPRSSSCAQRQQAPSQASLSWSRARRSALVPVTVCGDLSRRVYKRGELRGFANCGLNRGSEQPAVESGSGHGRRSLLHLHHWHLRHHLGKVCVCHPMICGPAIGVCRGSGAPPPNSESLFSECTQTLGTVLVALMLLLAWSAYSVLRLTLSTALGWSYVVRCAKRQLVSDICCAQAKQCTKSVPKPHSTACL